MNAKHDIMVQLYIYQIEKLLEANHSNLQRRLAALNGAIKRNAIKTQLFQISSSLLYIEK